MADALTSQNDSEFENCDAFADTEIDRELPRSEFLGSAQATIYPPAGQDGVPVHCTVLTRDLSNRGFGIAHKEPVRPRQRVELETPQGRLTGEVLWCRQIRPEFYIIGCRRLN
jgi:hypothetical protein